MNENTIHSSLRTPDDVVDRLRGLWSWERGSSEERRDASPVATCRDGCLHEAHTGPDYRTTSWLAILRHLSSCWGEHNNKNIYRAIIRHLSSVAAGRPCVHINTALTVTLQINDNPKECGNVPLPPVSTYQTAFECHLKLWKLQTLLGLKRTFRFISSLHYLWGNGLIVNWTWRA